MHVREHEQAGLLLLVLLGLLEQVLQHLGVLEPVIELGVLLLVLGLRAQQGREGFPSVKRATERKVCSEDMSMAFTT